MPPHNPAPMFIVKKGFKIWRDNEGYYYMAPFEEEIVVEPRSEFIEIGFKIKDRDK